MPELPVKYHPAVEEAEGKLKTFFNTTKVYSAYDEDFPLGVVMLNMGRDTFTPWSNWDEFRVGLKGMPGLIGMGKDRTVVNHPWNPKKVVSVYHKPQDWYFMAETRALHDAMSLLFPHNFPRIHSYFGWNDEFEDTRDKKPEGFLYTGFITDYIEGFKGVSANYIEGLFGRRYDRTNCKITYEGDNLPEIRYPIQRVIEVSDKIGLPIDRLGFDVIGENFVLGQDGGEYYVDLLTSPFYAGFVRGVREVYKSWDSDAISTKVKAEVQSGRLTLNQAEVEKVADYFSILG